jgi:predicted GNAT family acetyltransferase
MKNNQELSRFELEISGQTVYATYKILGSVLNINYVFAPQELRGSSAAGKLMEEIVQAAKKDKLKINPVCGYAAAWLRKHKEYHDLLA